MEAETRKKCQELLSSAEEGAQRYWAAAQQRMDEYCAAHEELQKFLGARGGRGPET